MILFTEQDKEAIQKYFGATLEELDMARFEELLRELRSRFHPDNFEKFDDEAVREMATERFQLIEALATKLQTYFTEGVSLNATLRTDQEPFMHPNALFRGNRLKIEIITSDKDLKYRLFGARYRWLKFGDTFKIPGTEAALTIDEDYAGASIGYQESIRMYLTFDEQASIEAIVDWLYSHTQGQVRTLLVAGMPVPLDPFSLFRAIRQRAFLRVELPAGT